MENFTTKQADVLKALRWHPAGMTPTKIGQACGKDYGCASSWANTALKSLQARGYVSRERRDGNVLYSLTEAGKAAVKELAA